MVPVVVDSSTVAITSAISAVVTFGFCGALGLRAGPSLAIAAGAGIALYSLGVIPVGLLVVVGIGMVGAIFRVQRKKWVQRETNAVDYIPAPRLNASAPPNRKLSKADYALFGVLFLTALFLLIWQLR